MADLIDRDELFHGQVILVGTEDARESVQEVMDAIWNAPAVDAEPVRHGTWKERKPQWYCSACEKLLYISVKRPSFNYCPFCGAKMDGGEDG